MVNAAGQWNGVFRGYRPEPGVFDEVFDANNEVRPDLTQVVARLDALGEAEFNRRRRQADSAFLKAGITFSVYSDRRGAEKIFPFDIVPRIITPTDWERIERGVIQRIEALNAFCADVYGPARILAENPRLRETVESSKGYLREARGIRSPGGVHAHVVGVDLLRRPDGEFTVLEDNARVPSGVSYVLENRQIQQRALREVFHESRVRSVSEYPLRLRDALAHHSGLDHEEATIVVLTPGPHNSAYFEHSFLARRMGCPLVVGSDLFVWQDRVYLKTTRGPVPVHVIYRRVDDDFLDPEVFRKDSLLGVPGLMRAYRKGNVVLANAVGNGVADDKAVYPFVPEIIRFYLDEEPILPQVETFHCSEPAERSHVLERLNEFVVKEVDGSGGYGMLIGPLATAEQVATFRDRIEADPRKYIAQPVVELSTCPTWTKDGMAPRRVDLRPYVISGATPWVLPGGLTRVALVEGSIVVNSSQGGGSKDTWVLQEAES